MSSMKMLFHTKQTNYIRKTNRVRRVPTPAVTTNPNNVSSISLFASPMIERVTNARVGCSACGR
jgi:hypothetical protein